MFNRVSHIVPILISMFIWVLCLLCAIHFPTIATDVLLCTLFMSQSCKDDRTFTQDCCLRQNMRTVANELHFTYHFSLIKMGPLLLWPEGIGMNLTLMAGSLQANICSIGSCHTMWYYSSAENSCCCRKDELWEKQNRDRSRRSFVRIFLSIEIPHGRCVMQRGPLLDLRVKEMS